MFSPYGTHRFWFFFLVKLSAKQILLGLVRENLILLTIWSGNEVYSIFKFRLKAEKEESDTEEFDFCFVSQK